VTYVCMRLMATPPSSIAKSNPRCIDLIPVAMSVRLPDRGSKDGLESPPSAVLPLEAFVPDRLSAAKLRLSPIRTSWPISRWGCILWMYRNVEISSGANPNLHALPTYRGRSASGRTSRMENQKYAEGKMKR
jgi:hypothetical protein